MGLDFDPASESDALEQATIEAVDRRSEAAPAIVTVKTDDDEYIQIAFTREAQTQLVDR